MTSFEWVLAGDHFSPIRFAIERASAMTEGIEYLPPAHPLTLSLCSERPKS